MNLRKIISFILIILCVVFDLYLKYSNIDMTDARLLIEYWKEYLVTFFIIILNVFIFTKE